MVHAQTMRQMPSSHATSLQARHLPSTLLLSATRRCVSERTHQPLTPCLVRCEPSTSPPPTIFHRHTIVPQCSTAPIFHRVLDSAPTTESVLLTATDSGVLAALNPVGGLFGSLSSLGFFDGCSLDVQFWKYQNAPSFFLSLHRSLILVCFFVLSSSSTIRPRMGCSCQGKFRWLLDVGVNFSVCFFSFLLF
jgi:hypothetical protein